MTIDQSIRNPPAEPANERHADGVEIQVQVWILDNFPLARERSIEPADSLLDSGIIDSLGTLELVAFLEREFSFVVEDEDMVADHFETVASITAFVKTKLKN